MGRKIVFRHRRAVGDGLMVTSGIRDFKLLFPDIEINADTNFPELYENNPYVNRDLKWGDDGVECYHVGYPSIQSCNNGYIHFTHAFLLDMIAQADAHEPLPISLGEFTSVFAGGRVGDDNLHEQKDPFIEWHKKYRHICKDAFRQWGDIHLTDAEKKTNIIRDEYGANTYWVIAPGGKSDCTTKIWDWRRFQKVIDYYDGAIKFVTIGRSDHILDKLDNVIDFTDKTPNIRDLFSLVYHADGCVSGVSFLMHLCAAMPPRYRAERKACVAIYGGREPTSFTGYCNHQILHTNGALTCCDNGGCWQSRVVQINKYQKEGRKKIPMDSQNKRLCHKPVESDGRTIPQCMAMITSDDVIRAIERYYDGDIYKLDKPVTRIRRDKPRLKKYKKSNTKEINILASLQSRGGGEQSAIKIVEMLRAADWTVHLYPWGKVHDNYKNIEMEQHRFKDGSMLENMAQGLPLLFYANDQIWDFCDESKTREIVKLSSSLVIGINYCNGSLPKSTWLAPKLRAIIFQNQEKLDEFERDALGFKDTQLISLHGAISLDEMLEVPQLQRRSDEPLTILKHGMPDYRKYTTEESLNNGDKIHIWQKHVIPELDIRLYERLLKDVKNIRFEFMEAHPEVAQYFRGNPQFEFHKFDAMPVKEFLGRGHIYLHKTSKMWRDQYPRSIAEALAAGLPVLGEPRDGVKDRIVHGTTGFYCVDYDAFLYAIKLLMRKEQYRFDMGKQAKLWAKKHLDPKNWVRTLDDLLIR